MCGISEAISTTTGLAATIEQFCDRQLQRSYASKRRRHGSIVAV
jgi:hypothetical protein